MGYTIPSINWSDDGYMNSLFQETIQTIKNCDDTIKMKNTVDEFMVRMQQYIEKYFESTVAGNAIKYMIENNLIDDTIIKGTDFVYAQRQYDEYVEGMNRYINGIRENGGCDSECKSKIDDIIEKDFNFVKGLFTDTNGDTLNPKKEMSRKECFNCLNVLMDVYDTRIQGFKSVEYDRSYISKLTAHTSVCYVYFIFMGVKNEIGDIICGLNCTDPNPISTTTVKYAVF